jgi:hypothetical protein
VKIGLLVVIIVMLQFYVAAQTPQEIKVNVTENTLSEVFISLKEKYGFQFAFDKDLLSQYSVTLNKVFHSEEETLTFLIKNLPLQIEKSGKVFLIMPKSEIEIIEPENIYTRISGQVLEKQTYEPLPFSYILINNKSIQADQQGNFSFLASADTSFSLKISHLGYYIFDTLLTSNINKKFLLTPQMTAISQILVKGNPVEKSTLIGDKPGKMKINHRIAPILPGYGDNSVFNLLRLLPGVLAAGEQSNDLLIWGSYESHSKIQFDGFTVFGLKNFNDNISVVNPFVVKNIEIYKGGYEARYGGRVGGIIDITGKNGNLQKPSFTFNINNTTLNSLVEIPVTKNSSLLAAYRKTYYQLYDPTTLNLFQKPVNSHGGPAFQTENGIDFTVVPNYNFSDANLKYTVNGKKGQMFYLSFYGGGDRFLYNMDGDYFNTHILRVEEEKNRQIGGALHFSQPWKNGGITKFLAGYSVFEQNANEQNKIENTRTGIIRTTKNITSENNVDEFTLKAEHNITLVEGHNLVLGTQLVNNNVQLLRKSLATEIIHLNTSLSQLNFYIQDELPIGEIANLKTGFRVINALQLKKWFAEPRIAISLNISKNIKLNASWGLYNQFMAKTSLVDSSYNFSYFWTNSDNETIPVLNAGHWVGGISYNKNGFTFSTEGYYKTTTGINRFFNGTNRLARGFYHGEGRSYGVDLYIKKEYKQHMAWISYTLSKTEEHFPFFVREYYLLAPHHQTHELKLAGIVNLKSFYLSANYVYGSGFERYDIETEEGTWLNQDYKRLDASLVYKLPVGRILGEFGISVLNVLNTNNIKYSNLRRATVDEINLVGIYAEAVPFTPSVFLKIEF